MKSGGPLDLHYRQTDINGNPLHVGEKPIAYLYGSFWFDPECAEKLFADRPADLSPAFYGETCDVYAYHCDECGKLIQPQLVRLKGEGQ